MEMCLGFNMAKLIRRDLSKPLTKRWKALIALAQQSAFGRQAQRFTLNRLDRAFTRWPALRDLMDSIRPGGRTNVPSDSATSVAVSTPHPSMNQYVSSSTVDSNKVAAATEPKRPDLNVLVTTLRSYDADAAATAAAMLGKSSDPRARSALIDALGNRDGFFHPMTRIAAAQGLSHGQDELEVSALIAAVHDFSAEVSLAAIAALCERAPTQAVTPLTAVVDDPSGFFSPSVRQAAERALSRINC